MKHKVFIINASAGLKTQLKKVYPKAESMEDGTLYFVAFAADMSADFGIWPPVSERMCWTFQSADIRIMTTEAISIIRELENA
jgi:hypothetical protein